MKFFINITSLIVYQKSQTFEFTEMSNDDDDDDDDDDNNNNIKKNLFGYNTV
jgi:hypothetical protein